uniref:Calcium-binding protein E63-1 n=1 Tax=Aceria tosichella TaxID=561515 RepID=A0A6G1S4R2_9ACAR
MPLLGRHKSLPGSGANQSSGKSGQAQPAAAKQQQSPPLVCESPLFGVRRQLPVATQPISGQTAPDQSQQQPKGGGGSSSTSSMPSSLSLSSRLGSSAAKQQLQHQQSRDGQLGSTLSSIPKQISRQQIHYAFAIMDTNSDGLIDLRDLSQMLANLGVPIDEAILSHVMTPISKRGDHLISENEFLDWIGNFIQVNDEPSLIGASTAAAAGSSLRHHTTGVSVGAGASGRARSPMSRSASASHSPATSVPASLVAQSPEAQYVINQQMRQRRGSGSGLALVRSLSSSISTSSEHSSAGANSTPPHNTDQQQHGDDTTLAAAVAMSKRERLIQDQQEARRDLKAAFCVFDLDGDGFITIDEVQQGLKLLGETWSQAELNQLLFSQCNSNKPKQGAQSQPKQQRTTTTTTTTDLSKQRISIDDFVHLLL